MKREGFWRTHETENVSGLPWPVAGEPWEDVSRVAGQSAFLDKLAVTERHAGSAGYRGHSNCRLCGIANGSRTFILDDWQWPSGYRHYVEVHNVRPSPEFERFVNAYGYIAGHLDEPT